MDTNKVIILIISVAVLGIVVVGGMLLLGGSTPATPATQSPGTSGSTNVGSTGGNTSGVTSTGGPAESSITLTAYDGGAVTVRDFKKDSDVLPNQINKGYYTLGYQPTEATTTSGAPTSPYLVTYVDTTQYFNITLLQEPLKATRAAAEQYLGAKLGLPQVEMCRLKYMLSVPASVSEFYTGQNLGFSFCPGAVLLP